MANINPDKDEQKKNPNEDSVVTDNLTGKKVDADLELEADRPAEGSSLITQQSQKGKKVDADPEQQSGQPTEE